MSSPAELTDARGRLVLTYDNTALTDGAGAQLQRIYGIYAISKLLGAAYLHSPLARVDYQGLTALEAGVNDPEFHGELNDLFHIDSDVSPDVDFDTIALRDISLEIVQDLAAGIGRKPTLVRLVFPYGISDRFPDCYEACKAISPFERSPDEPRTFRVAIHVRRGELFAKESDRMLPNEYYVNVARAITRELEDRRVDHQLELWSEVPSGEFVVRPDDRNFNTLTAPVVLNPQMYSLREFDELTHLVRHLNGRAVDTMRALATADVLVMSRSSFSYLCGILNRRCIVLYHPFWHSAPSSWIAVGPDGRFDATKFAEALAVL